jgi:hypothetical protein
VMDSDMIACDQPRPDQIVERTHGRWLRNPCKPGRLTAGKRSRERQENPQKANLAGRREDVVKRPEKHCHGQKPRGG